MSVINRMLQDLDARGGQPGAAAQSAEVRTVPQTAPSARRRGIVLGALVALLVAVGMGAWRQLQPPAVAPGVPPIAQAPVVRTVAAPAPASATAPVPASVAPPASVPTQSVSVAPSPAPVAETAPTGSVPAPESRQAAKAVAREPDRALAPDVPAPGVTPSGLDTPAQRAGQAHQRALASLADGRVNEAIVHLESALRRDPRHEASRQILVGLLIEADRPDEAMRHLEAALALDPRQPSLAMLLARLQIERGDPGIATLLRTLPHAAGNGQYHAFLAGALQRAGRHGEAVEHYTAALRSAPQQGVWWMGLAMALEGLNRPVEAVEAYRRARASTTLSPELQAFVERKLTQLDR